MYEQSMTQKNKRTQFDIMHPLFNALEDSDLSTTQRMIILGLFRYMDGEGKCFPSYKALEKTTGATAATLARNLKQLVEKNWIFCKQGSKAAQQSNTYYLNLERLGLLDEVKQTVVPLNGFIAPDGTRWECAAYYWEHLNKKG